MRREVGDIRDPDLLRPSRNDLPWTGLQKVGMAAEAMMAIGRLVIGPFSTNQLAVITQDFKQAISANMQILPIKLGMHQGVQLAGTDAGLSNANLAHEIDELLVLLEPGPVDPITLVISLATDPHKLASPADTQGLGLRNDLPGRFFRMDTP
ncbi:hypothetical protein PS645_03211 [Pseudomonas fluorescens]|uniref:Uncharacterized protein n=1 Tax=Pseudomonas fluorescens TaxID=294 RepID=A0A5E6U184_PSEFL|nr:hypothetical protein PS645_03211 [Pseudomonas fluorescens]